MTWIYSGWNKIEERKTVGSTVTTKNFVWGLDLSQSMEGAGGIGGLIAVVDQAGSASLFAYDGNGNVSELIDTSSGSAAAHYEYDAFGNAVLATGPLAQENTFRFSTKQIDPETGLYDFGMRAYEPVTGRWINRDPIRERGGLNLYAMVGNNPVNEIDPLGLFAHHDGFDSTELATIRRVEREAIRAVKATSDLMANDFSEGRIAFQWPAILANPDAALVYGLWYRRTNDVLGKMGRGFSANTYGVEKECTCILIPGSDTLAYVHGDRSALFSDGDIHFCPLFFDQTYEIQVQTFVHEMSHYFGDTDDLDYGWVDVPLSDLPADAYWWGAAVYPDPAHFISQSLGILDGRARGRLPLRQ